jgi:glycosyltransferase involved in cell wall biosynthesis
MNGLSFITSSLASALAQTGYELTVTSTTGRPGGRSLLFHGSRLARTFRALFSIASTALLGKAELCYFAAEGDLGLIYSLMIAGWARLFRIRLYIHHHSFSYIVQPRPLMRLLLAWSGTDAVHICLCFGMAQDLANCYQQVIHSLVLSNAAFVVPATAKSAPAERKEITIGLLSNLTPDKGLYQFIELLRVGKLRGLPIRGVLAGPIVHFADKTFLESLKEELGRHLDYRGPVYDAKKAQFFEDIDVFVFPTTYPNEAQPTVLFEAMAHGIPVISFDRGCIRSQVRTAGRVVGDDADFVLEALQVLELYRQDPEVFAAHQHAARVCYENERCTGQAQIAQLFDAMPTKVIPVSKVETQ